MFTNALTAFAATFALVSAQRGFNYGSTFTTNAPKGVSDFEAEFRQAKGVDGLNGTFTSARLYTCIQAGAGPATPIEAFQAAINTNTHLLLGLWASGGQDDFNNEMAALATAIQDHGDQLLDLIDGISVGSEDLYRISPTGIENGSNPGVGPDIIVKYINQLRDRLRPLVSRTLKIGHVDTYTAFINDSNAAAIEACDFLGMDAYPYFQYQSTMPPNSIENGETLFFKAFDQTVANARGAEVWITETGWPVSGPDSGAAVASIPNAEDYWKAVACEIFSRGTPVWWYTLQDAEPDTPSPSFGLVGAAGGETPLYDLTCSGTSTSPDASASSASLAPAGGSDAPSRPVQSNPPGGGGGDSAPVASGTGSSGGSGAPAPSSTGSSGGSGAPAPSDDDSEEVTETSTTMSTVSNCPKCPAPSGGAGAPSGNAPASAPAAPSGSTSTYGGMSTAASPHPSAGGATPGPVPTPSGKGCPADLSGNYEFPHLIIPVDSNKPDQAPGTSYNGKFTSSVSSIFNFDIPGDDAGKTCSLVFLLPNKEDLVTSSYTLNHHGGLVVEGLSEPATEQTSFNNMPKTSSHAGSIGTVEPGHTYVISSFACPAGSRIGFEASGTKGLDLDYFQDFNPSPIGLYITVC